MRPILVWFGVLVFLAVLAIEIFICWISGYNFDSRNIDVGGVTILSLVIAIGITGFSVAFLKDNLKP